MLTSCFIVFLLTCLIVCKPTDWNECSLCQLNGFYQPSNGYECFLIGKNETICTCPDRIYSTINRPCRICQRTNICGNDKSARCSEESTFFDFLNRTWHFACFCSSGLFEIGKKCPEDSILPIETTTFSWTRTSDSSERQSLIVDTSIEPMSTFSTEEINQQDLTTDSSSTSNRIVKPSAIILISFFSFI